MSSLGNRIKYIRDDILRVNQSNFAGKLGFSRIATISDYEKDKRSPDITALRKIATLGGITLDWLLTGEGPVTIHDRDTSTHVKEAGKTIYTGGVVTVEVYAMACEGGLKGFPSGDPIDAMTVPSSDCKEGTMAVRLSGDCMSPTILDGATVGIDTTDRNLISGKLYAVWQRYEGVTIKRVYVYHDRIVLKPDNTSFPETVVPTSGMGEEFIVGKVKWVYQSY